MGAEDNSTTPETGAGEQTPPAQAPAAAPSEQRAAAGKNIVMPPSEMARIRREERDKGKRAAAAEIAAKLKQAGAESIDDLIAKAKNAGRQASAQRQVQQPAKAAQQEPQGEAPTSNRGLRREAQAEYERKLEDARSALRREEKKRKELERRYAEQEVNSKLRTAAVKAGIRDVDVALALVHQEMDRLDPTSASSFDEDKYFSNLAKERPYLAGIIDKPATTGSAKPTMPAPMKPGQTAASAAKEAAFDATKASPYEVEQRWRALGSTGTN